MLAESSTRLVEYVGQFGNRGGRAIGEDYAVNALIDSHAKQATQLRTWRDERAELFRRVETLEYKNKQLKKANNLSKWRRVLIRWFSKGLIALEGRDERE